jgi:PilZ domain
MANVAVERRAAPRIAMVLAAEVVELAQRAKLAGRTADISASGCYVDTLNPLPKDSQVRIRLTHHSEIFEALGRVVYVSPGLGMGVIFLTMETEQRARLDRWLAESSPEF